MDPWTLLESTEVVLFEDKSLVEELRELRKLRTAVMVEKCLGQNDVVTCPKPRRQQIRQCGGHIDAKVQAELSDIITSKHGILAVQLMTSGMAISHSEISDMYKAWLMAFIYSDNISMPRGKKKMIMEKKKMSETRLIN